MEATGRHPRRWFPAPNIIVPIRRRILYPPRVLHWIFHLLYIAALFVLPNGLVLVGFWVNYRFPLTGHNAPEAVGYDIRMISLVIGAVAVLGCLEVLRRKWQGSRPQRTNASVELGSAEDEAWAQAVFQKRRA